DQASDRNGAEDLPHGSAPSPLRADRLAREQGDHPVLDPGDRLRDDRLRHAEDPMSTITPGERIGVLGLARSGVAAAKLALSRGARVDASDGPSSESAKEAARTLAGLGADGETGGHDVTKLAACDRIVLSPGIPPSAPVLRAPELSGVPIVPELEFAYDEYDGPLIAVTGTNGKTTVTALTAHALRAAGFAAEAGGNIGIALSELVLRDPQPEVIVA